MCRVTAIFAAFPASLFIVASTAAQAPLARGDHLRVWNTASCCRHPQVGALDAVTPDSVILRVTNSGTLLGIPRKAITNVERGDGRPSRATRGAAIGFVAGALTGAAFQRLTTHCTQCPQRAWGVPFVGLASGVAGMFVGAAIGARHETEVWTRVTLPQIVGVGLTPGVRHAGQPTRLTFALSF